MGISKKREPAAPKGMKMLDMLHEVQNVRKPAVVIPDQEDISQGKKQNAPMPKDEWKNFLEYAREYKETKGPCIQIWLDADINYTLEAIRQSGTKIPVKHLLSAAVRVFLESNADEVRALMKKKPKMII